MLRTLLKTFGPPILAVSTALIVLTYMEVLTFSGSNVRIQLGSYITKSDDDSFGMEASTHIFWMTFSLPNLVIFLVLFVCGLALLLRRIR